MSGFDFLLLTVIILCVSSLGLFVLRLSRFPDRTIRDVRVFLRPVNSAGMLELLNPESEALCASTLTHRAFRWEQLRNLHYAREYMVRMSHNAAILAEWANAELSLEIVGRPGNKDEAEYLRSARKLHIAASEFRIYALLSLVKIRFWMIFRTVPWLPFAPPNITELRGIYGMKFFALYSKLTEAVSELGLLYGQEFHEELLKAL